MDSISLTCFALLTFLYNKANTQLNLTGLSFFLFFPIFFSLVHEYHISIGSKAEKNCSLWTLTVWSVDSETVRQQ